MKRTARRKISYVVKSGTEDQAHCLGVNSIAINTISPDIQGDTTKGGVLYSAGRDGVVATWDLHLNFKRDKEINKNQWILDTQLKSSDKTTCKSFSQIHTDWVNDMVLCDGGNCVVSASSDRTIKIWKPFSDNPQTAYTLGWHTDFAKCLTYASKVGWVASGGLDRKINIWDMNKLEASLSIDATPTIHPSASTNANSIVNGSTSKCSIYSIATNPTGTLLASGSPEKVVRLWDPRSGKRICKLTGHTDNIRALLVSDDGQYVLSGSSDSTIKLWSVKAQRCLTTYETHPDSVWSLYSDHPDLKVFYSGSRDGLVLKTEISGQDALEGESECVALFKEESGVCKITALEDAYVWTATSNSSINRWLSVPSSISRQNLPPSSLNIDIPSVSLIRLSPTRTPYSPQRPESFVASDSLTMYAGSILSIPVSYQEDEIEDEEVLIPLRTAPDHIIQGRAGITAHKILPNRRHVLTKDSNGYISLWDIAKCKQLSHHGKKSLEETAEEMSSRESFPSWCSVDTKIGAITVQLHESNCFDCEMYADEIDSSSEYQAREDQRLNIGKWVLCHLFEEFIQNELKYEEEGDIRYGDDSVKTEAMKSKGLSQQDDKLPVNGISSPKIDNEALKMPSIAITTNIEQSPYLPSSPQAAQFNSPFPANNMQPDYFSGAHHSPTTQTDTVQQPLPVVLPLSPMSPTGNNFMNRLKTLSAKAKMTRIPSNEDKQTMDTNTSTEDDKQVAMKPSVDETAVILKSKETYEHYTPPRLEDFPPLDIPPSTMVIIAEESAEASTGIDLYRGTVGSTGEDADTIMNVAPSWLLSYLLYNKTPFKEAVKLTFIMKPDTSSKLNELPGGLNNRLSANRILRVRKLMQYISEKLQLEDESALELLCGDTILTPTMTLATIKQHILKSPGDIPITYRLKDTVTVSAQSAGQTP